MITDNSQHLPNFLFIGPDKAGSSWIFELFKDHPQIFVPACKDIYFFDRYYSRGLQWYSKFFPDRNCTDYIAIGELSHDYLFSTEACERIAHDIPDVKLIVSLRDPADRAFSHYLYMIRSGRTKMSFQDAVQHFPELIEHSCYHKALKRYFHHFSRSQMCIVSFRDLQKNPVSFANSLFNFLGVNAVSSHESIPGVVREASKPKNFILASILKSAANYSRFFRLETLVGFIKHSWVVDFLYTPYSESEKPKLTAYEREWYLNIISNDTRELINLLDKDCQEIFSWLKKENHENVT